VVTHWNGFGKMLPVLVGYLIGIIVGMLVVVRDSVMPPASRRGGRYRE
jgi:hypothetical protein